MKILVCISKAPDTTSKIGFVNDNTEFNKENVQFIINPYDEWYALVRALELKEAKGGTVTVINVGLQENEAIIRKALAIGADDAIRVDQDPIDAFSTASQIANHAKEANYDLILCGKETIDYNGSEVAGMLSEMLDLPFVSLASKLDMDGDAWLLEREIEGGKEVLQVSGACVVSCAKGMAEQRIPNMRGIMSARTKPITIQEVTDDSNRSKVTSFELPPAKGSVKLVDPENVDELVRLLSEEAKAI